MEWFETRLKQREEAQSTPLEWSGDSSADIKAMQETLDMQSRAQLKFIHEFKSIREQTATLSDGFKALSQQQLLLVAQKDFSGNPTQSQS